MTKFKIGQKVRCVDDDGSSLVKNKEYRVIGHNDGDLLLEGVLSSWMASRFVAVDEDPSSPIRTRREIVPGVYGRIKVRRHEKEEHRKILINVSTSRGMDGVWAGMDANELREAAHLFNQIAEVLEENEENSK